MRSLVLAFVFVASVLLGAIAFAPMSILARLPGVSADGLSWRHARGTIWHGQLSGIEWNGNAAGNIELQLPLLSALSGKGHDVVWVAPFGSARANVRIRPDGVSFDNLTATVEPSAIPGIDQRLASLEGTITLRDGAGVLDRQRCRALSGNVSTDLARQVAIRFGRDWPLLAGTLACEDGVAVAGLAGEATDGTAINVKIGAPRSLNVQVSNSGPDVTGALQLVGFSPSPGGAELVLRAQEEATKP